VADLTDGLRWEFNEIAHRGCLSKAIFVVPVYAAQAAAVARHLITYLYSNGVRIRGCKSLENMDATVERLVFKDRVCALSVTEANECDEWRDAGWSANLRRSLGSPSIGSYAVAVGRVLQSRRRAAKADGVK
jgi:hypothetical protein